MSCTVGTPSKTIFHIGLPKTGTTFLQRQVFKKIGAQYAHASWNAVRYQVRKRQPVERNMVFGNDDQSRMAILSHESIVATNPLSVSKFVKSIAVRPIILCVTRNPESWVRSYYVQQVRLRGEHRRFPSWYRKNTGFLNKRMNYDETISTYINELGRENVFFLPYEMMQKEPSRFRAELSKILGVALPEPDPVRKTENQSLDPKRAELLRRVNLLIDLTKTKSGPEDWERSLRSFKERLLDSENENHMVRKFRRLQKPILRTDRERSHRLSEVWSENRFVEDTDWGNDYGQFYQR